MRHSRTCLAAAAFQLLLTAPVSAQTGYSGVGQSFVAPGGALLLSVETGTLTGFSYGPLAPAFFLVALSGSSVVGEPLFQQRLPGTTAAPFQHVAVNTLLVPGERYAFFLGVPNGSTGASTPSDVIPGGRVVVCALGYPGVQARCDDARPDAGDIAGFRATFVPEPQGGALLATGLAALAALWPAARRRAPGGRR